MLIKLIIIICLFVMLHSRPQNFGNPDEWGPYTQGDMRIPEIQKRNGYLNQNYKWINGTIPYTFHRKFKKKNKTHVLEALHNLTSSTNGCIKFMKRNCEEDYVTFIDYEEGCWSYVGRIGGQQMIQLGPNCTELIGVIQHEILHTLGLFHEQSRPNRDQYVTIVTENLKDACKSNFEMYSSKFVTSFGLPYDYLSLMHYSANACSRDGNITIVTKDLINNLLFYLTQNAKFQSKIGQRNGLSKLNIEQIMRMYKCKSSKNYDLPERNLK